MDNREFFDNMAEKWDSICCHPGEKIKYVFDKINLEKGSSVLDIGSGTGIIIPYIEKEIGMEGKLTALDVSEKMIEISKKKNNYNNLNFAVEDFYLYSCSEKYDCIIAYSCYPHFTDSKAFFEKAYSLLKVGGKIIIAHVEGRDKINSRHNEIDHKIDSNTLDEVEITLSIMRKANLEIIYAEDSEEYYICIGRKLE
ncbi:class I SAM-dependent methyltransferase [Clostridiaceae bacterium UIB06]|uniref:Class I SAM-dependent methyltransferase n=1 Tax=Clostridium thailandense TaxID=2794346 RepID=A0A949TYY5_9CLOT|nr:class I SAM-dependent methyltransferase [Clostridium thailandense]MBV7275213.1 class I SAM-dependent methyltransferase [Clostridium thailandense]MCH5136849.1 class I SAM-dependent methyltransferase [Clostridiaceae bacterium UIB06]